MARFLSISSGSNGNCYYIGDERTALIVDAGVGFRTVKSRLAGAGVDIASVEMIFVTHDHVDHIRGLASVAQRLSVPVYATARLHDALSRHKAVGPEMGGSRRVLRPGFETEMRGVRCLAFEVPHDATQTLGYRLDFFGKVPYDLIKTDPNYASIFISNLGSIKLNAAYHHLNNWGTNSLFVVIGQKHVEPVFSPDGTYVMHEMLHVGITLDERIADGYYYARSIELFKYLMEHPEELDRPANEEVAK